jgi:diacylglycerol kinase family enzyme
MMASGSDNVHLQVDGEYAGLLPARVSVVRDALTLLVPEAYGKY